MFGTVLTRHVVSPLRLNIDGDMSRSRFKLLSGVYGVSSIMGVCMQTSYLRNIPLLDGREATGPSNRVQRSAVDHSEFLPGFRRARVQSARTYCQDNGRKNDESHVHAEQGDGVHYRSQYVSEAQSYGIENKSHSSR